MIINNSILSDLYKCNKYIMRYLLSLGIPAISYDDRYYYYVNTELLKKSLEAMPLHLKIMGKLSRKEGGKM